MDYNIRQGSPWDIPALAAMVGETILCVNRRDYILRQVEAWAGRASCRERWADLFASELVFWVAEQGGKIVGVSSVDPHGYLHSLFVHKDFQGQGIATALLFRAQDWAAGKGAGELTTEASITARPFFMKNGFFQEQEQVVEVSGVTMNNFRMRKILAEDGRNTGK